MSCRADKDNRNLWRKMNPETLAALRGKGLRPGATICITNVFYVGNKAIVDQLENLLRKHARRVAAEERDPSEGESIRWYIEADIDVVLGLPSLDGMTDLCVEIAEQCDAEYDGWFTEVHTSDLK